MSSTVALSVILPTVGRSSLEEALTSCLPLGPRDRVFVVADTNQPGLVEDVADRVAVFGDGFVYVEHDAGFKHYGCPQRNVGVELAAEGSLLVFQDDTDVFADGGLDAVREAGRKHGPVPMLFEVDLHDSGCYLDCQREIRCGEIDGHQLVVPKLPGRVAAWPTVRYESDFDWVEATLALWPEPPRLDLEKVVRVPELLSVCFERKEGR